MTKIERRGGASGQSAEDTAAISRQEGDRPDHRRSGSRDVVPFRRKRRSGTARGRRRRDATVHTRASAAAAGGRRPPSLVLHGGGVFDRLSVDLMPDGVSMRYLVSGDGQDGCLCLIDDDRTGAIVALGHGTDATSARFAACADLQSMRRKRIPLAVSDAGL